MSTGSALVHYLKCGSELQRHQLQTLRNAFDKLDLNRDGYITAADARKVFRQQGKDASERAVLTWIKEKDTDHDGRISFPEFVASFDKQIAASIPGGLHLLLLLLVHLKPPLPIDLHS